MGKWRDQHYSTYRSTSTVLLYIFFDSVKANKSNNS